MHSSLRAVVVPAAVFQSFIVGGAYGTGREVVEYISRFGPLGGLYAIAIIAVAFSAVLCVSFEFARIFDVWDYRRFLTKLLGKGWIVYEILFLALLVVILAITGSAAGNVLHDRFGIAPLIGTGLMFLAVVMLNFYGRTVVNRTLTLGAMVLVSVLIVYLVAIAINGSATILTNFQTQTTHSGWLKSGITFAVYNSATIPVIIYCATELKSRREAIGAGILAGILGVFPALVFHVSFMAGYPDVIEQAVPTYWMIEDLGLTALLTVYVFVLFTTVVQTGVGVLQGLNERLDGWYQEIRGRGLHRVTHAIVAGGLLLLSLVLAKLGIVTLVAKGYGTLAWGFFAVFTIPLLTLGIVKIARQGNR